MSNKGRNLGGIRELEDLRIRCHIDLDTHCWEWRGCCRTTERGESDPRVWLADQRKTTTIQQASWLLSGKPLKPGYTVWQRCKNPLCGNPGHLMVGTKAQWGAWASKQGYLRGRPERSAINRRNAISNGRTVLTAELAEWIRESSQTGREIAKILGTTDSVVSRCRMGYTFAVPRIANSIFTFHQSNVFKEAA